MTTNLTVTESAQDYLRKMLAKTPGAGLRISIKKTGCSGYSYLPSVAEAQANDTKIQVGGDIQIYLDTAWLHLLDGVTIDYIEDDKTGLKQKRLVFINNKETGRCGCGESFHVE